MILKEGLVLYPSLQKKNMVKNRLFGWNKKDSPYPICHQ